MTARRSPCSRTAIGRRSATVREATPLAEPGCTVAVSMGPPPSSVGPRYGAAGARRLSQRAERAPPVSAVPALTGRGVCPAGCLRRLLGLLGRAAQRREKQGLVDPAVEDRDAHLHTLRDH